MARTEFSFVSYRTLEQLLGPRVLSEMIRGNAAG